MMMLIFLRRTGFSHISLSSPINHGLCKTNLVNCELGRGSNNQNGNLRWFMSLGVEPPLNCTNFQTLFYPSFFLLQLNPTYMKRTSHFQSKIELLCPLIIGTNIDILWQLRPLTATIKPCSIVHSHLNYYIDII